MSARLTWTIVWAAVAAGAVLRAIPCWNDFWLDEIWTYFTVLELSSPREVFTGIHHSNNHHLNSLFFYLIGDHPHWALYRIPALLCGTASVALAAGFAARRGRLEAVLAALLHAGCFALIHFSSEARGYAPMVCFSLAALWTLELDLEQPRAWTAALFALSAVLGILSQLVFLFFYAGALVDSAWRILRHPVAGRRAAWRLARLHGLPLACLALLYAVDLRHLRLGGGPALDLGWLLSRTFGFGFGLPPRRELVGLYVVLGAILLVLGLRLLARERSGPWLCFLITILVAPLALLGSLQPEVVAVRYFLTGIAFCLLLLAFVLARALRTKGTPRAAALSLLALFLAGNAVHTRNFLEHGRGGFLAALLTMAEGTSGTRIVVGSDHDFRNETVLRFYARRLPADKTLDYRPRARWPRGGPEWFILHRAERPAKPPPSLVLDSGVRLEWVAEFDHAAISGFYWALYRKPASARRSSTTPKPSERNGSSPRRASRR